MNNVSPEKKETILKTLAIIGFLFLIIFIAWLAVKAVNLAPTAFSSLASIAESIDQYKDGIGEKHEDLELMKDEETIVSGSPVVLSWTKDPAPGTYFFSFDCLEGVTVEVVDDEGLRAVSCDTNYDLGDTNTVTILVTSDKVEPITLTYTVDFTNAQNADLARSASDEIVINPDVDEVATDTPPPTNGEDIPYLGAPEPEPTPQPTPTPSPTPSYTYILPVSDPNGRIDLGVIYSAVGSINGNTFRSGTLVRNSNGALQFEVKNYGTKTSSSWTYTVSLPDGDTYTSPSQTGLKPNERAVIAIGFPTGDTTSHSFSVKIKTTDDTSNNNNTFSKTITFSR